VLLYTKIQKHRRPIKQRLQVYQLQQRTHPERKNKQSTSAASQLVRPKKFNLVEISYMHRRASRWYQDLRSMYTSDVTYCIDIIRLHQHEYDYIVSR
jgi:hypothetical protein